MSQEKVSTKGFFVEDLMSKNQRMVLGSLFVWLFYNKSIFFFANYLNGLNEIRNYINCYILLVASKMFIHSISLPFRSS